MVVSDEIRGADGEGPGIPTIRNHARLYWYLAPLIIGPFLILLAAILIVPTDWFAQHSGNPFLVTLGYGSKLRNVDCQIVIYGDSTAMIGITPAQIRQRTGLSTCNIAETEGMTMLNGTMVLDQYLQQNAHPRFLVFMYSPEGMDPRTQRSNPDVTTFEAVTYRFRQPNRLASFFTLMRHPEDVFTWAEHGVRMSMNGLFMKPLSPETKLLRFNTFGQSTLRATVITSCAYPHHTTPPDKQWVNGLRSKYSSNGTTVLIDSVLLPDCDPDLEYFRRVLPGVVDNRIDALPVTDFYDGGRHVNPLGSVPLSNMVADQVIDHLHAESTTGAH